MDDGKARLSLSPQQPTTTIVAAALSLVPPNSPKKHGKQHGSFMARCLIFLRLLDFARVHFLPNTIQISASHFLHLGTTTYNLNFN
jgi:hypothetical protein